MLATHEWPPIGPAADAPVAILVHGVTGWHRTWWRVGSALAERGWHAIAVDQRGHGRSPRIDGFTTIGELAADLAATIERIGAPVDALIGHSLGAAVSAELAYMRPELVRRLVVEAPSVTRADDTAWHAQLEREHRPPKADPSSRDQRDASSPRGCRRTHESSSPMRATPSTETASTSTSRRSSPGSRPAS